MLIVEKGTDVLNCHYVINTMWGCWKRGKNALNQFAGYIGLLCTPISSTPQRLTACHVAPPALKCLSATAKVNTHPEAWKLKTVSINMFKNWFIPLCLSKTYNTVNCSLKIVSPLLYIKKSTMFWAQIGSLPGTEGSNWLRCVIE